MKHIISLGAGVQKRGRRGRVDEGTDKGGRVTEKKPICYELFAGLFGWGAGFIAEGYKVIGFDIKAVPWEQYRDAGFHNSGLRWPASEEP